MIHQSISFRIKGLYLLLFILFGCQAIKPVKTPNSLKLPETFPDRKDTVSIGLMPRQQFFPDSNLSKLIDTAIHRNFDLQRALQNINLAKASLLNARRIFLPRIDFAASAGVERYGDYTMNGVGNYDSNLSPHLNSDQRIPSPTPDYFLGLRSNWEIGLWGRYRNAKKAAYLQFLSSQKGRHFVMTSLIAALANLYYDLLALDNELLTIRNNIELQRKAVITIEEMKKGGMVNELAVKQFQSQLLNTQALEIETQQQIIQIENSLNLLIGRLPQPIPRGEPIRSQELPKSFSAGVPGTMLVRRPDVQQAELELEAAKLNVKVARAAFLPSLSLDAYAGYNAFKAPLLFSTPSSIAWGAMGGLAAPLINRGLIKANYNRSVALQLDAFYNYQKVVATGYQEVVTHINGIINYQKVYDLKNKEVELIREAVDVSQDLFRAGYANYLEVITAQRFVLQADLELSAVKRRQFDSFIELYRALGGGWE